MTYCPQIGCPGHLGKFSSCRDEALHELSLDGFYPTTGDVEFEGHFTLIKLYTNPEIVDLDETVVTVPTGFYIVQQHNSGLVTVWTFATAQAAEQTFDTFQSNYLRWADES